MLTLAVLLQLISPRGHCDIQLVAVVGLNMATAILARKKQLLFPCCYGYFSLWLLLV